MINYETAESILFSSVESLINKNDGLTKGDLLNEITNVICLYILKSQRKELAKVNTFEGRIKNMLQNMQNNNYDQTTEVFLEAAMILPQFEEKDRVKMPFLVEISLKDPNQWELLKQYFLKFHNLNIDDL